MVCVSTDCPSYYKPGVTYRVNTSHDGRRLCLCSSDPLGTGADYTGASATWKYVKKAEKKRKGFAAWVKDHA